jgi:acyl-lipid omega-6 desaturase (Delta-12 desaturase)
VRSTTHVVLPLGLNRLAYNILEHTAHHVDPRVPLYHLPGAQARLEEVYPEDVVVERLTPAYVLRILRTCRLYDYRRRQWLDYDGTPTSPSQGP